MTIAATGCLFQAAFVGDTEFPASSLAATRNDFAAVFRLHALAKAVLVFAGAAGWLVGTFHRLSKRIMYCYSKLERKGNTTF